MFSIKLYICLNSVNATTLEYNFKVTQFYCETLSFKISNAEMSVNYCCVASPSAFDVDTHTPRSSIANPHVCTTPTATVAHCTDI